MPLPSARVSLRTRNRAAAIGQGQCGRANRAAAIGQGQLRTRNRAAAIGQGQLRTRNRAAAIGQGELRTRDRAAAISQGQLRTRNRATAIGQGQLRTRDRAAAIGQGELRTRDGAAAVSIANGLKSKLASSRDNLKTYAWQSASRRKVIGPVRCIGIGSLHKRRCRVRPSQQRLDDAKKRSTISTRLRKIVGKPPTRMRVFNSSGCVLAGLRAGARAQLPPDMRESRLSQCAIVWLGHCLRRLRRRRSEQHDRSVHSIASGPAGGDATAVGLAVRATRVRWND